MSHINYAPNKAHNQKDLHGVLLIHPPVFKPCEPPAGLSVLAGALSHHNIPHKVIDANLEGLLSLLGSPQTASDTWTTRAFRHVLSNLESLRHWKGYGNIDRYKRIIADINRVLEISVRSYDVSVSLSNYQDHKWYPVRSTDLIKSAEASEKNIFYPYFKKRFLDLMESEQPFLVGFSLNYFSQALCTFAMIGFLKRICPEIRIVLGGGLVTSWMRNPHWQNPFKGLVDEMIAGPGEVSLLSIFGVQSDRHYTPDFSAFEGYQYMAPGFILPYSASSGCYWNKCSFCPEKAEGNPYLVTPVETVMKDIDVLTKKTKPSLVHLLDNAITPKLLYALTKHQLGMPWYGFARISSHLANLDFCMALKQSGCVMLSLGLESGDQGVLESMNKGIDLEITSQVLKNLRRAGIVTYAYLLFGTPSEGIDEARRTLDFTVRHSAEIDFLNLAIFYLPIYGPDTEKLDTSFFYQGDLSLYDHFSHPKGWNRNLVRQFLDKEFKRHPAIAPILRRDPPSFTSNHAPLFATAF